jgi:3-oxoacyl-[acyl-carrier protein] reductase
MSDTPRTAIVTGAARGIGASVARRLCRDGITVAVLDLDEGACQAVVDELRSAGGTAQGFAADVSDEASVEAAVAEISRSMGPPLILVNNAGILRDNLLFKMTVDDWDAVMGVHLRGAFLMSRAAQRHMIEAGWGRIVNLSSTSALGNRGQANYAAAKAGMQGFTKTLAIELGRYGGTVNAIAPGFIESEMTIGTAARIGVTFEDLKAAMVKEIPVGRAGTPDDVSAAVAYFVRDDASFVSGQVLYVAGGPRA